MLLKSGYDVAAIPRSAMFLSPSRGREMTLRCRDYNLAVEWARIECKTYNVASGFVMEH
jgi:hypothetical protein